jgi:hypothetical protein
MQASKPRARAARPHVCKEWREEQRLLVEVAVARTRERQRVRVGRRARFRLRMLDVQPPQLLQSDATRVRQVKPSQAKLWPNGSRSPSRAAVNSACDKSCPARWSAGKYSAAQAGFAQADAVRIKT